MSFEKESKFKFVQPKTTKRKKKIFNKQWKKADKNVLQKSIIMNKMQRIKQPSHEREVDKSIYFSTRNFEWDTLLLIMTLKRKPIFAPFMILTENRVANPCHEWEGVLRHETENPHIAQLFVVLVVYQNNKSKISCGL